MTSAGTTAVTGSLTTPVAVLAGDAPVRQRQRLGAPDVVAHGVRGQRHLALPGAVPVGEDVGTGTGERLGALDGPQAPGEQAPLVAPADAGVTRSPSVPSAPATQRAERRTGTVAPAHAGTSSSADESSSDESWSDESWSDESWSDESWSGGSSSAGRAACGSTRTGRCAAVSSRSSSAGRAADGARTTGTWAASSAASTAGGRAPVASSSCPSGRGSAG
ncbi:hypothetical protein [Cellulomonas sp. ATA003]|uniref:hypothetical protein n=1 Tax=Cellulomonas sp. ATA003 TaxID=3073064 RepID=UPI002873D6D6|nr:hypothetical protein [Cellulomonas sp. ATA003]WNB85383.1 hypothetical protein REH70_17605 [Cellulomonas sp. ATA003]